MICTQDEKIYIIISLTCEYYLLVSITFRLSIILRNYFLVTSISIVLFSLTLYVYVKFKDLQDFYGKCVILLIGNQIITYILCACLDILDQNYEYDAYIVYTTLKLSTINTLLWITVMIFYSFRTFV